jgi:hypothetical protein
MKLMLGRLALLAPHVVLTVLALASRSTVPMVLGRWSKALFAFNVVNVAALLIALLAARRGRTRIAAAALFVLLAVTYVAATNNELSQAPLAIPLMIASRLGIALSFVVLAFEARARASGPDAAASPGRALLAIGSSLLALNVVDAAGVALFGARTVPAAGVFPFRRPVDLARIEPDAVVLVGDSFVWGEGVEEKQAFAHLLGVDRPHVYNLGLSGTGLPEYVAVLKQVPARDTAIVCFYMNDMAVREPPLMRVRQALVATGKSSFFARLASDLVGLRMYPDAAEYERAVIADYDPRDPTFAARWDLTASLVRAAATAAKRDARHKPIFVILPLMVEYARYPLRDAHAKLASVAAENGFEVLDMLPIFAKAFPHGEAYKVGPNDNHFNAEVHAKVAEVLRAALAKSASRAGDR